MFLVPLLKSYVIAAFLYFTLSSAGSDTLPFIARIPSSSGRRQSCLLGSKVSFVTYLLVDMRSFVGDALLLPTNKTAPGLIALGNNASYSCLREVPDEAGVFVSRRGKKERTYSLDESVRHEP